MDLEHAVSATTDIVFYDDPLYLEIPYILFLERLPDAPNGEIKSMLSHNLILVVYFYPVARGLIIHRYSPIFSSLLSKYNRNVFVRHGIRHREK